MLKVRFSSLIDQQGLKRPDVWPVKSDYEEQGTRTIPISKCLDSTIRGTIQNRLTSFVVLIVHNTDRQPAIILHHQKIHIDCRTVKAPLTVPMTNPLVPPISPLLTNPVTRVSLHHTPPSGDEPSSQSPQRRHPRQ